MPTTVLAEIARYLRAGEYDLHFAAWPGDFVMSARRATSDLKNALIAEIRRRADDRPPPAAIVDLDLVTFTRRKIEPMVRGLFPGCEQEAVLGVLERSVVVLTPDNICAVLEQAHWLHTAWDLANIYLGSIGAEPLGEEAAGIVGLSQETTCYLSTEYFRGNGRFSDFLVHEAAHIFHNCKRCTVGLPETRTREWLLDIEFRKRETFAYACEAYSRIIGLARTPAARTSLVEDLARGPFPSDERVDPVEYLDIVREAAGMRNGWKRILSRCAPQRRSVRAGAGRDVPERSPCSQS